MRAALLHEGSSRLEIVDVEYDAPIGREVLIRIEACGLCHSDLHCIDGTIVRPRPQVLGHEAVGFVEAVGDHVSSVRVGMRVITCLLSGCGDCSRCLAGELGSCLRPETIRRSPDAVARVRTTGGAGVTAMGNVGSLAEYVVMDERGVIPVGDDVPAPLAAILGCAVVTGLGAVFNVARVRPTESVAVIGCGGVGLNVIQGARIAGASRIIAVDLTAEKLELAGRLGATDLVDGSTEDPVAAVAALTGGGVDHAFEVVGRPATAAQAFAMVAPGRRTYIVGIMADGADVVVPGSAFRHGKSLVGVFMGGGQPRADIPRYIDLWRRGLLDLESMVVRHLSLDDVNGGFDAMARGEVGRSVVVF